MKRLMLLLPVFFIFVISCTYIKQPVDIIEEKIPTDVVSEDLIEDSIEDIVDESIIIDFKKPFEPKEYEIKDAFPNLKFEQPLLLTNADDGSNIVYVVEKGGKIKSFKSNIETTEIFLDLSNKVNIDGSEKGLLGLAFHPNYKENGYFFVNYTDKNSTIISRYKRSQYNPNIGDLDSEEIILNFNQPFSNHNGGYLEFGLDGYLYIATGDGGGSGDPQNNSQNLKNYLGKILRIDVDSPSNEKPYTIPKDNPFAGNSEGYMEEIYAYGLRNPWRFSFDVARNLLIAADVGQDKIEEINIIEGGGNYGWNIMEGTEIYGKTKNIPDKLIPPIWEYNRSGGRSVTGGYTYFGTENPSLLGAYIYGDFISGKVWALWIDEQTNVENYELLDTDLMISSFGIDENSELYIVDFKGKIYRLNEKNN